MVLSPYFSVFIGIFVLNCRTNAYENETDFSTAVDGFSRTTVDEVWTTMATSAAAATQSAWRGKEVSDVTTDRAFTSDGDAASCCEASAERNVTQRSLPDDVSSKRKRNANPTTTPRPKPQKPAPTVKSPPKRPNVVTKPSKQPFQKNAPKSRNATTVWPKPDKRLSGGGGARKPPNVSEPLNRTDDSTSILVTDFKTKYPIDMWKDHGFYTDDYMQLINKHWFQYTPPNPSSHYVLGILYTIITIFGCFGNSLVIFMYIKCKSLQTPANVLIMNLAVSDFFMLAKSPIIIYNSYYQGPTLGKLGCQIYGFLGGLTGTASIVTLAAISLDRYYVIVHPLNAAVKTTKQRARIWICLIWLYAFMFSIIPVLDLGFNHYVPEGYLTSCSFDYMTDDYQEKGFILVFFTAAWCIPFTTISYCYVKIVMAVWVTSEMAASRFGQEEEKRKTEIRLGYVVIGVIVLWFVSWTPYAMVALLGVFEQKEYVTPLVTMIPALFCKTASCVDPWIYAITHPRFKNELTKLLSKKKTRKLERDYVMKKGWDQSRSNKSIGGGGIRYNSSTEDEDVEEVVVVVDRDNNKMHRQGSTSSHKTEETKALETKFPPTRQESLKYMPPSWYKMPRTTSRSSIKLDAKPAGDNNNK